jgi:hypothetical protein
MRSDVCDVEDEYCAQCSAAVQAQCNVWYNIV